MVSPSELLNRLNALNGRYGLFPHGSSVAPELFLSQTRQIQ